MTQKDIDYFAALIRAYATCAQCGKAWNGGIHACTPPISPLPKNSSEPKP